MGSLLARAARRLNSPAVRHADGRDWRGAARPAAEPGTRESSAPIAIDSADPLEFGARAIAALLAGCDIMLCNPRWTAAERAAAEAIRTAPAETPSSVPRILVSTGGSSGRIRFATHTPDTLEAAAIALQHHCSAGPINSVCALPLYHISGFQQLVRSLATGGELLLSDWHGITVGEFPEPPPGDGFSMISLVPTQLHRLVRDERAVAWLRTFDTILLGGAAAGALLLEEARNHGLKVAIAYGSSETAAAVALEPVSNFLQGEHGLVPLPHAAIRLVDPETGGPCAMGEIGRIMIDADSLFLGYWPKARTGDAWPTEDLGRFDGQARLQILGRADAAINTGGEKVHPAEVEAALRSLGITHEVVVLGVPDPRWGECVAAFYPATATPDFASLESGLRTQLSPHKLPRRWIPVTNWPLSAQGKTDRAALRKLAGR